MASSLNASPQVAAEPPAHPAPGAKVTPGFLFGLLGGFLLLLGLTALAFWLNLGVPTNGSRWAYELNQKKRLLAERAGSPKLLLVGGSATLFGLSARELEAQTGMRTINLGTHAALGTSYILQCARVTAKPGDTVLLVLEYELYNYGKIEASWADKLLLDYIVSRDPAYFYSLTPAEKWNVFMLTPYQRLKWGLKNRGKPQAPYFDSGAYSVRNLNDWGDQTRHTIAARASLTKRTMQTQSTLARGLSEKPKGFALIRDFCDWARANHIRVLATFPNLYDRPDYHTPIAEKVGDEITQFFASLNVPVVGKYTDALLPPDKFFDTIYHLTQEGAIERTQALAVKLKPYLEAK